MLRTTEEVKRRVLDHLEAQCESWNGGDYRPFTHQALVEAVDCDSTQVLDKAVESLKEEKNVQPLTLHIEAYVPASQAGKRVARGLAGSSQGVGSWIPAVLLSMVILYALLAKVQISPSEDLKIDSIPDAYQQGILTGVFLAGLLGLILAVILHQIWTTYKRSELMHEEKHRAIAGVTKISMIPALILVSAYVGMVQFSDYAFNPFSALALFAAGFPIGWGYTKIIQDQEDNPA